MATKYTFQTIDNPADPTFNQLLGINTAGAIAGYFGSGAVGHPNQGYERTVGGTFVPSNFPGSTQTQTTGINNNGYTVGFYSPTNLGGGTRTMDGFTTPRDRGLPFSIRSRRRQVRPSTSSSASTAATLLSDFSSTPRAMLADIHIIPPQAHSRRLSTIRRGFRRLPRRSTTSETSRGSIRTWAGKTHGFLDHGGAFTTLNAPGFAGGMT